MDRTTLAGLCALEYNWSESDAHRYVNEFLDRFLVIKRLTQYESTHCAPSPIINLVWRQAVLLTKAYAKECGHHFIHYSPVERINSNDYRLRYEYTISMYKSTFKAKPPGDIWPAISRNQDKVKQVSEPFYLIVEDNNGKQIIIDQLYGNTSVSFLHTRIQEIEGIPFEEQMLLLQGEALLYTQKLSAYRLKEGSVLKLSRKPTSRWTWMRR